MLAADGDVVHDEQTTYNQKQEEPGEIQIPPQDQDSPILCLLPNGKEELYLTLGGLFAGKVVCSSGWYLSKEVYAMLLIRLEWVAYW